jgi:hypothetical protein
MISVTGGAVSITPSIVTTPSSAIKDTTASTTSARDAVLGTPELLEAIIYLLPSRDILANAQSVSRMWKSTIVQSPGITKKLCLKSQAGKAVCCPIRFVSTHAGSRERRYGSKILPVYPSNIAYNLLPTPKGCRQRNSFWAVAMTFGHDSAQPESQLMLPSCEISLRNPSAVQYSWLNMYLTEPGITTAWLAVYMPKSGAVSRFGTPKLYRYSSASVRDADGLTFATIVTVAEKICWSAPARFDVEQARVQVRFAIEAGEAEEDGNEGEDGEDEEDGEDGWVI